MKKIGNYISHIVKVYAHEFSLALHDPGVILFFTFLPLAYPVIYSLIYNPELAKNVEMIVVDHDRTPLSRELARNMNATDEVWVTGYAANLGEARQAMDNRECFAILEIPEGFERRIGNGETGDVAMYCDMTLLLRYRGFLMASTNVMQAMGSELMTKDINTYVPIVDTLIAVDPLMISDHSMGNLRSGFDSFIMPGVIILILHQCIVLASGMAGGARRENRPNVRKYNRLVTLSPHVGGTMIAQTLCFFTILLLPAIYMIHYVPLIFRFPMAGNLLEELVFIIPMIIACCGMGFVFQSMVTERESVFLTWVVTSVVFLLLSGLIWPRCDMYPVWRWIGSVCPSTWGVEGFIKMNSNGASLADVRHEYCMLWILAAFWWICGYCCQRWVVRPAVAHKVAQIGANY
ncbi:MAG: ABC transporter permease [Candidatus Amulumruptor caecigallinarius]|nr:ABC transporter permease [Candidatus Amulumruptor caecigallinarius]